MSKRIDAEKQHLEDELKKLEGLSASSGAEAFNSNLTEEQEEWVHRKLPDDPFKIEAEGDDFVLENLTHEEWQSKLTEKYQRLYDSVKMNLPSLWDSLEFELSIQKILNIRDCTLPFAGIVLGRGSSMKTVGIEMFRNSKNTFFTDNFSAKAFVSHSTAVKRQELEQIDLLPKIRNKLFLSPELSPTFTKKDDDLVEVLGIITRVLDGHGYESDTGAHGHRGYHGEYMFTWVGAAVDIPWKVHKYLGTLGPKLYFLRLPKVFKTDDEYRNYINKDDFIIKTKQTEEALIDYLNWFERCPNGEIINNLVKISWNRDCKDDQNAIGTIIKLGKLLAHLRGVVPTWETRESQGLEYAYTFANIEEPDRAMVQLRNLARGHALSQGRNYLTMQDIPLLINVVLSTASMERARIFNLLLEYGGTLTTTEIEQSLNVSVKTAKRTMAELKAIELVSVEEVETDHGGSPEFQIKLFDQFKWCLSPEFKELRTSFERKNFTPVLVELDNIQNCIVQHELEGGLFSSAENIQDQLTEEDRDYPPDCYYCDLEFHGTGKQGYENHIIQKHSGKPGYPRPADIEFYKLTPKGMNWEK
jgi:predicted DNA-binding transcriptional regulator